MTEPTPTVAEKLASPPVVAAPETTRRRPRWPGIASLIFAVLTVAGVAGGIVLATSDEYGLATYVAWGSIGASALAVVLGLIGLFGRFGRGPAIAGLVLGVIANPLVLTQALDLIGGLWA